MILENLVSYIGITKYRSKNLQFGIKDSDRSKHLYILGKTGTGKSTLIENLVIQDIKNGNGLVFLDPHGSSAERILNYISPDRAKDLIYFSPQNKNSAFSFNPLENTSDCNNSLVADGLLTSFKKIWQDSWSARMEYILNNTLLALLETKGTTLLSINRMLTEKIYREHIIDNITDPAVLAFWKNEFEKWDPKYAREACAAIINKTGQFVTNPIVRNIIGQEKCSIDLRQVIDSKKIFIINLSKGNIGEDSARLLGGMFVTKLYIAALSRANLSNSELEKTPQCFMYIDEFQSFVNESFSDILSEARKYKLSLIIAHQFLEQLTDEIRAAVLGNVGTMIIFRTSAENSLLLEKEFLPEFDANNILSLRFTEIYIKLMIDNSTSRPFFASTLPLAPLPPVLSKTEALKFSEENYNRPVTLVEEEISALYKKFIISKEISKKPFIKSDNKSEFNKSNKNNFSKKNNQTITGLIKSNEKNKKIFDKNLPHQEKLLNPNKEANHRTYPKTDNNYEFKFKEAFEKIDPNFFSKKD